MLIAEFTLKLPVKIKRKAKVYISNCPVTEKLPPANRM